MMTGSLWSLWTSAAPAIGRHLWQSTLFAIAAAMLTVFLRRNQARARYWLWLAASLKFLVPFSSLVAMGSYFAWHRASTAVTGGVYVALEDVTKPFVAPEAFASSRILPSLAPASLIHVFPALFAGIWFCGFAVVLLVWSVRWRKISSSIHGAKPLVEGREVEALRRFERAARIPQRVEIRQSSETLEPGIFGLTRPVLVWPEGISEHLDDAHLDAILAHELWHVRRRDNLAAAVHMVVEAIFWFHPLVWWLGARLVDERERACDEEVLELGSERHVYAQSILKVCEFCVGSPLACVSGVTGADLKKRMVHIMSEHVVRKLDFSKRLLLTAAAVVAIGAPIVFGLFHATPSRAQSQDSSANTAASAFESATVKPSQLSTPTYAGGEVHAVRMMTGPLGFKAENVSLRALIQEAYGVQANQIEGPSDLLDSSAYDIEGKTAHHEDRSLNQDRIENHLMLQNLLADRFKLAVHHGSKELPSYALVVEENGSKLQPSRMSGQTMDLHGPSDKPMEAHRMVMHVEGDQVMGITAVGISIGDFSQQLSRQLGSAVVDKTGLTGNYDFNLQWKADTKNGEAASGTSLFKAVKEQLGLQLEPQKTLMDIVVIDHVEMPTEN